MLARQQIPDRVLMYASLFTYAPNERNRFINYAINEDKILQFQGSKMLPNNSLQVLQHFMQSSEVDQRNDLDNKKYLKDMLRVLFEIVKNVRGDADLLYFALVLINGIFEDKRIRIRELVAMQKSNNDANKCDAV